MERGREARTSGQVDVVFGIGQWLWCLRQQGINGGGLDEIESHEPTKETTLIASEYHRLELFTDLEYNINKKSQFIRSH